MSSTARRVVFLDVDGTIADASGRIADSTVHAVQEARSRGHLVFLSTGRAIQEVAPAVLAIGFDGAVTAGGGFATIGDELVVARTMPDDLIARMLEAFEAIGTEFYVQSRSGIYPSEGVHRIYGRHLLALQGATTMTDAELPAHPRVRELMQREPVPTTGIAKGVFLGEQLDTYERVAALLDEGFHCITGTIPGLGTGSGEVSAAGVTKGGAIADVLEALGIDAALAIGIGDGANDVEMFDVCGIGIAMAGAAIAVRERADEVTTGVLDDGIWNAFARHGLV